MVAPVATPTIHAVGERHLRESIGEMMRKNNERDILCAVESDYLILGTRLCKMSDSKLYIAVCQALKSKLDH